jgi:hypothetical protein
VVLVKKVNTHHFDHIKKPAIYRFNSASGFDIDRVDRRVRPAVYSISAEK